MQNKFTKSNFIAISKEVLDFQLNTIYPIKIQNDPIRTNLIFLNHDRNFSTFLTMKYLVQHERVADIFTLSRSMFESIITMGLLARKIVTDDIERYQEFQYLEIHKTYSHLKRLGFENLSGVSTSEAELVAEKRANYIKKWDRSIDLSITTFFDPPVTTYFDPPGWLGFITSGSWCQHPLSSVRR